MPNYCSITIAGHLGRAPEVKFLTDGKAVANFSIAVTEKRKGKDDETTWFNISAFGQTAENVGKYLDKGRAALVQGRIRSRKYQDKDGNDKVAWEVLADRVVFLPSGEKREASAEQNGAGTEEEIRF